MLKRFLRFAPLLLLFLLTLTLTGLDGAQMETTLETLPPRFDIIVVGSEPEGVAAAVAAAEEGAETLLVTEHPRIGGLFVMGAMNSLDLRTQPELYQRGLFLEWWRRVGGGTSFDVDRAERAFEEMLQRAGVMVLRAAPDISPVMEAGTVTGVTIGNQTLEADAVIDATADGDVAAAAGVPFSVGFASLGLEARMVDTLVFRIDGVDWRALRRGARERGKEYASVDDFVAWGHFGGYPAAFEAQEPGLRLRGLNLGRQDDGSVLVNALLIYDIDPFDRESVQEGFERASREAPRVIDYLKEELPGFEGASFGGVADALYIRDSRHFSTLCTLTTDDVLDNRVTLQDVAAGGYPLDVQTLTPFDSGFVYGTPEVYGARLCMNVPQGVQGLWVVGKTAGYDPLAASSARVVPFGMAVAEAVGVAAAGAAAADIVPAVAASDLVFIARVRNRLAERGAYLPMPKPRSPLGPWTHPHYESYRLLASRGLALGGYENNPKLDEGVHTLGYVYLLSNVGQRFLGDPELGKYLVEAHGTEAGPLAPDKALAITRDTACYLGLCIEGGWQALKEHNLAPDTYPPEGIFTRGEMYALAARLVKLATNGATAQTDVQPVLEDQ